MMRQLFLLLVAACAMQAAPILVTVNTPSLNGTPGTIYLGYSGFTGTSGNSSVVLTSFSNAALAGLPVSAGGVTGMLPGPVTFSFDAATSTAVAELTQLVTYGDRVQFLLNYNNLLAGTDVTSFFVYLLDETAANTVLGDSFAASLDFGADGSFQFTGIDGATASAVPEPGSLLLIGGGLAMVALRRRRA